MQIILVVNVDLTQATLYLVVRTIQYSLEGIAKQTCKKLDFLRYILIIPKIMVDSSNQVISGSRIAGSMVLEKTMLLPYSGNT